MQKILLAILLVVSSKNVYSQWEQLHGSIMDSAWVIDVAVSEHFIWAATVWNGLWKQNKLTGEWQFINTPWGHTADLAIQGENIYALDNGSQVIVSSDTGNTWQNLTPAGTDEEYTEIIVDDTLVIVGGNMDFKYARAKMTGDTGQTWTGIIVQIDDELFSPGTYARSDQAIFAAAEERMFRSYDNGITWEELQNGPHLESGCLHCELVQLFASGDLIYALEMNDYYHSTRLHVSDDNGDNWNVANFGQNESGFNAGFNYFLTYNEIILANKVYHQHNGVFVSFDHGLSGLPFNDGLTTMNTGRMDSDDEFIYLATGGSGVWRRKIEDLYTLSTSETEDLPNQIAVFPNPSNGNFKMRVDPAIESDGHLKITDMHGRVHLSKNIQLLASNELNVPDLTPGIYSVSLQTASGIHTTKIIVQK